MLIRNVAVLVVPETGECRVDEAQDIHVDSGRITAITPTPATSHEPATSRRRGSRGSGR
ncbi:hypothetical protein OG558_37895 [Kribbella sp. NBC_01510]|uniref:hypothetical protein n=1 Tax=Kribbella sp. NBC_01510 TaxID=2903581 RepID=UPI00386E6030